MRLGGKGCRLPGQRESVPRPRSSRSRSLPAIVPARVAGDVEHRDRSRGSRDVSPCGEALGRGGRGAGRVSEPGSAPPAYPVGPACSRTTLAPRPVRRRQRSPLTDRAVRARVELRRGRPGRRTQILGSVEPANQAQLPGRLPGAEGRRSGPPVRGGAVAATPLPEVFRTAPRARCTLQDSSAAEKSTRSSCAGPRTGANVFLPGGNWVCSVPGSHAGSDILPSRSLAATVAVGARRP
jgi:hypothetical protein